MRDFKQFKQLLQKFKQLLPKRKRGPKDMLAMDFDPTGINCVRMRKVNEEVQVVSVAVLPPYEFAADAARPTERPIDIPKSLLARHAVICLHGNDAVIKLLNLPGEFGSGDSEAVIREHMGIGEGNFRIGYRIISHGHGRAETKLLTVAIPDTAAQAACALFPAGPLAPMSVEVSGLAVMTAFLNGPAQQIQNESFGAIECGAWVTIVAFFNAKSELVFIRKFDFGTFHILDKIQQSMGVDRDTAQNIVSGGSFDISQLVKEVSDQFTKQLVISKHFVERRENCHLSKMFISSGVGLSRDLIGEIKTALELDMGTWTPFDAITLLPGALPKEFEDRQARFAAAIGAGLGTFEEEAKG